MAKLPPIKRFILDDVQGITKIPDFASKLYYPLNLFLNAVYSALNNGLTITANTIGLITSQSSLKTSASGTVTTTVNWPYPQSPPQGVAVLSASISSVPALSPLVSWSYSSGVVTINLQFLASAFAYEFTVASSTVKAGAVYSSNGQTFTATQSTSSATVLEMVGTGAPSTSGTLTLVSGTGTSPISYSAAAPTGMPLVSAPANTYSCAFWITGG